MKLFPMATTPVSVMVTDFDPGFGPDGKCASVSTSFIPGERRGPFFETMVFVGGNDCPETTIDSLTSWDHTLAGAIRSHERVCAAVKNGRKVRA